MRTLISVFTAVVVLCAVEPCFAQRGGPPPERIFQFMDRDGDGVLKGEELTRFPPLRQVVEEMEIDTERGLTLDEYIDVADEMRERMSSRGFGGDRGRGSDRGGDDRFRRGGDEGGEDDRGSRWSRRGRGFGRDNNESDDEGRDESRSFSRRRDRGGDDRDENGGDDRRSRFSRGFGRSERDSGGRSRRGDASEEEEKKPVRVTLDLPSQYSSRDRDGDGQIGLYEWSLDDLAGFARLDFNGDGFLTPRELHHTGRTPAAAATPVVASVTSRRSDSRRSTRSTRRSTSPPTTAAAPASASSSSGENKYQEAAEFAFRALDRDKDGTVAPEEWARSRSARPLFEKGGVDISQPMSQEAFIANYIRLRSQ